MCDCCLHAYSLMPVRGHPASKMRFILADIWMISPLMRHSFLLSSSTVFMLSIHRVSTGPSNTTHFLSSFSALANSL